MASPVSKTVFKDTVTSKLGMSPYVTANESGGLDLLRKKGPLALLEPIRSNEDDYRLLSDATDTKFNISSTTKYKEALGAS